MVTPLRALRGEGFSSVERDARSLYAGLMKPAASIVALACAFASSAHAEPGGTSGASGVAVSQGALKLETRTALFDGGAVDNSWAYRAQASYGVTDWWRTQVNFRGVQPDGGEAELRNIGWENAVDFVATRDWPIRLGGQVEYRWGVNGASDSVEFKLLAERRAENFNARFNLIAGRDVGGASEEWGYGYAGRALWTLNRRFQVGVEGFGEFDSDAHAWGPRAGITFGPATLSAGYLASFGAGAEADSQIRFSLELSP